MSSNSKKLSGNNSTKFTIAKLLKVPAKILAKARDLYVRSLTECSGHVGYGSAMGCPSGQYVSSSIPKSFSMNSTPSGSHDDDYHELVRFASARTWSGRNVDPNFLINECRRQQPVPKRTPLSRSVGIGRIDEERPSYFLNDKDQVVKTEVNFRSKSYSGAQGTTWFYY